MKLFGINFGKKSGGDGDGYPDVLRRLLNQSRKSKSGPVVSKDTALQVGTVFACVRAIAEGVAQVPFSVMQETKSTVSVHPQRLPAKDHDLYDLLHRKPNDWQTSFEFRETLVMHLALTGVFRAKWSAGVHEEWISSLLQKRPDLTRMLMDKHALSSGGNDEHTFFCRQFL